MLRIDCRNALYGPLLAHAGKALLHLGRYRFLMVGSVGVVNAGRSLDFLNIVLKYSCCAYGILIRIIMQIV